MGCGARARLTCLFRINLIIRGKLIQVGKLLISNLVVVCVQIDIIHIYLEMDSKFIVKNLCLRVLTRSILQNISENKF